MRDKVTVIIPAYNRSEYLLEAIQSVIAQGYEFKEIIVVDDGSTDDTKEKLELLIASGKIRYHHQENSGRSAARNKGISLARGDYIAFLDSDDLLEPGTLERQVGYLMKNPHMGLVHGGYVKFDDRNNNLGYRNPSWFSGWIYPDLLLQWFTLMATPTVMVPKAVMEDVGGFDESLYIGEDLDMWRRIARRYPFGFIKQSLARIRVHEGNTSVDAINATNEFERYLARAFEDDNGLSNRFKHRALSRMFSNQAYILLNGKGSDLLQTTRLNARRAIANDPLNPHGYMALLSTLFGYNLRQTLIRVWRRLRAWLMSRNRLG